jgi:hypothetical protein
MHYLCSKAALAVISYPPESSRNVRKQKGEHQKINILCVKQQELEYHKHIKAYVNQKSLPSRTDFEKHEKGQSTSRVPQYLTAELCGNFETHFLPQVEKSIQFEYFSQQT